MSERITTYLELEFPRDTILGCDLAGYWDEANECIADVTLRIRNGQTTILNRTFDLEIPANCRALETSLQRTRAVEINAALLEAYLESVADSCVGAGDGSDPEKPL